MTYYNTIEEICTEIGYQGFPIKFEETSAPLEILRLDPGALRVDREYQRLISLKTLNIYGKVKLDRLTLPLVSHRPAKYGDEAGYYVLDGQQRSCMYHGSGLYDSEHPEETGLQASVKIWPQDCSLTIEELRSAEAKIFVDTNTNLSKVSTLQKYRAGVMFGDPDAKAILDSLITLNLRMDNFGSIQDDADEISPPTHYFTIILQDLGIERWKDEKNYPYLTESLSIYRKIYSKKEPIHGVALRCIFYAVWFLNEALGTGRKKSFKKYLTEGFTKHLGGFPNPKSLVKEQGGFNAPKYILHDRILPAYNNWVKDETGAGTLEISNGILAKAAAITGITSKVKPFLHPDSDAATRQLASSLKPSE